MEMVYTVVIGNTVRGNESLINCIKQWREISGLDLKVSKDFCQSIKDRGHQSVTLNDAQMARLFLVYHTRPDHQYFQIGTMHRHLNTWDFSNE